MMTRMGIAAIGLLAAAHLAPALAAEGKFCNDYNTGESVVLFLIDRTSQLGNSSHSRTAIARAQSSVMRNLKEGQRLEISTITDNVAARQIVFSDCMPGRKVGMLERPLNQVRVGADKDIFVKDVTDTIKKHLSVGMQSPTSGVLETISALSAQYSAGRIDRLVIYSDLLDSSSWPGYWTGGAKEPEAVMEPHQLQEFIGKIGRQGRFASLKGADVEVYGFGFYDFTGKPVASPVRNSIEAFWQAFFERSGAASFKTIF